MRYRVVQHFGRQHVPIFATLEVENEGYASPTKIQEETRTIQKGGWIEADITTLPASLVGPWTVNWFGPKVHEGVR